VRRRTTLIAAQEAVAHAKAVGATEVVGVAALHQAGRRASPLAMSIDAATSWALGARVPLEAQEGGGARRAR
jgi:hypothetical protein